MTACLAHIAGVTATLTGVNDLTGEPFMTEIPFLGVLALNQQCAVALMGMERERSTPPPRTTDEPPEALVGSFQE